jgi:hypothetical protein
MPNSFAVAATTTLKGFKCSAFAAAILSNSTTTTSTSGKFVVVIVYSTKLNGQTRKTTVMNGAKKLHPENLLARVFATIG